MQPAGKPLPKRVTAVLRVIDEHQVAARAYQRRTLIALTSEDRLAFTSEYHAKLKDAAELLNKYNIRLHVRRFRQQHLCAIAQRKFTVRGEKIGTDAGRGRSDSHGTRAWATAVQSQEAPGRRRGRTERWRQEGPDIRKPLYLVISSQPDGEGAQEADAQQSVTSRARPVSRPFMPVTDADNSFSAILAGRKACSATTRLTRSRLHVSAAERAISTAGHLNGALFNGPYPWCEPFLRQRRAAGTRSSRCRSLRRS